MKILVRVPNESTRSTVIQALGVCDQIEGRDFTVYDLGPIPDADFDALGGRQLIILSSERNDVEVPNQIISEGRRVNPNLYVIAYSSISPHKWKGADTVVHNMPANSFDTLLRTIKRFLASP